MEKSVINIFYKITIVIFIVFSLFFLNRLNAGEKQENGLVNKTKKLAYLVSDIEIPFWKIMSNGIKDKGKELGYEIIVFSANNIKKNELENLSLALKKDIDGLIISPINSSTAVTILRFAKNKNLPVVICDIGTEKGEYISFISSNNKDGAYKIGKVLTKEMKKLSLNDGTVGIISIPQKRANGKERTDSFMKALYEDNIKTAGLLQQVDFSYAETYRHTINLIKKNKNIKAIWLQGSDKYNAALDAIYDCGKKDKILLLCFDAEPEFINMISTNKLLASAMQQPYLMGLKAVESMDAFFKNKSIQKEQKLEVLVISKENLEEKLPLIEKNVFGIKK